MGIKRFHPSPLHQHQSRASHWSWSLLPPKHSSIHQPGSWLWLNARASFLPAADAEKGTKKRQLYNKTSGHQEWVTAVTYTPDGKVGPESVRGPVAARMCSDTLTPYVPALLSRTRPMTPRALAPCRSSQAAWTRGCGCGQLARRVGSRWRGTTGPLPSWNMTVPQASLSVRATVRKRGGGGHVSARAHGMFCPRECGCSACTR